MKLVFLHMPGCSHCAATKPIVAEYERLHPEVDVVHWDVLSKDWPSTIIGPPDVVPAFIILRRGFPPRAISGREFKSAQMLERWINAG